MTTGNLVFLLVLLSLTAAAGWWFFTLEQSESHDDGPETRGHEVDALDGDEQGRQPWDHQPGGSPSPEDYTPDRIQAHLDAIRAGQRIGRAFWRASRALYDAGRDQQHRRGRRNP